MRRTFSSIPEFKSLIVISLPVALWAMLFVSLGAGSASEIWEPSGLQSFIDGVRAVLPFAVAGSAAVFIVYRVLQGSMPKGTIFGPLGLASLYGVVGFIAAFNSPDGSAALWWTGLYLSVPIVLWGIVWAKDPLDQIRPLVNATWLAVALAAGVLLLIAIFKLDFLDQFQEPSLLLKCRSADWFDLTSDRIRGTGVGRYAAITALVAISGMWMPKWRKLWSVLLVVSLVLLLYSAARGSFAGFGAGAALILIIYMVTSGKRAMATGLLVVAIALPVLWGTGILNQFLENCFFRSGSDVLVQPAGNSNTQVLYPFLGPNATGTGLETNGGPGQTAILKPPASGSGAEGPGQTAILKPPASGSGAGGPGQTAILKPPASGSGAGGPATVGPVVSTGLTGEPELDLIPEEFYTFSGRRAVWSDGWDLFKKSPYWGYGFHADRLLLGTHMHNSIMHAMLQAGLLGAIPFVFAIVFAWILLLRLVVKLPALASSDKHLVIQCAGVLAFFTMRSFPESTGAFFGVDWLIIAVMLFYLQLVNSKYLSPRAR